MVGSATTLQRYAPVEKLLNHLQQENLISFKYIFYLSTNHYIFVQVQCEICNFHLTNE